ncbi:hypothetical protein FQZ97_407800 [compost metagenome]
MPAKGARRVAWSSCASCRSRLASASRIFDSPPLHRSCERRARVALWSSTSWAASLRSARRSRRWRSRWSWLAWRQLCSRRLRCVSRRARASSTRACKSSWRRRMSTSPACTRCPAWISSSLTWPPVLNDRWARLQAFTVPARVLATRVSTAPLATSTSCTGMGSGRTQNPASINKGAKIGIIISNLRMVSLHLRVAKQSLGRWPGPLSAPTSRCLRPLAKERP